MSRKTDQIHAEEQRSHQKENLLSTKRSKPGAPQTVRTRAKKHAEKKATYALEETEEVTSRKSTRKSANRSKPDTSLNLVEQLKKGSPTSQARKAKAKSTKVRGKSDK